MNNIAEIGSSAQCCGCNACGDICPNHAITFHRDAGGFLYPSVDPSRCSNCGMCVKACPIIHANAIKEIPSEEPLAYAAIANDLSLRFDSTSGGVFSVLGSFMFDQNGFVGGAIWNDDFCVCQTLTNKRDDLTKLQSSKYIQSDARGFYSSIRDAIKSGRSVLIVGLPCQIAAVRAFLGKDYANLYTIDLICRSVGSPYYFQKYLRHQENLHSSKVVAIKQKDKGLGWRNLTTKLVFANGDIGYDPKRESLFMRAFEANMISRPSCYDCKFKGFPRYSDLTLGDCWGALQKLPDNMDNDLGTSVVLCHTAKGRALWDTIQQTQLLTTLPVSVLDIVTGNAGFQKTISPSPVDSYRQIYDRMENASLEEVMNPLLTPLPRRRRLAFIRKIVQRIRRLRRLWKVLIPVCKVNGLRRVLSGAPLAIPVGKIVVQYDSGSRLVANADSYLSVSLIRGANVESRIRLWPEASFMLNGGSIGSNCYILVFKGAKLEIGAGCCINTDFSVTCGKSIQIGKNVFIGQRVSIRDTNGDHFINTPGYQNTKPVVIHDHVWIASGATILPGVTIGAGSIVAGGAIVTRDVPPCTMVAGIPAKVIRTNVQFRC